MLSRKSRPVALVALLLLASIGVAVAAEPFVHTDDGCAVERHCLACRHTAGSMAVVTPTIGLPQALEPIGPPTTDAGEAPVEALHSIETSRGPPQA